jgi:hypothetical protein
MLAAVLCVAMIQEQGLPRHHRLSAVEFKKHFYEDVPRPLVASAQEVVRLLLTAAIKSQTQRFERRKLFQEPLGKLRSARAVACMRQ